MSAADLLHQVASRFWRALGSVLTVLPQDLCAALAWRVDDGDMRWALSLLLAGWRLTDPREPKADDISQLLKQLGATWVLGQINLLRGMDGFQLFVDRARDADSDVRHKAAGVALVSALERLERTQLGLLVEMLRHPEVRKIGQAMIRRFPTPGSKRAPVWGPPSSPSPGSSRGALFDHADYAARERALRQGTRASIAMGSIVPEDPPELPPVSAPALDEHAVTVAFLHTLGHSEADIARLMAGPPKKSS